MIQSGLSDQDLLWLSNLLCVDGRDLCDAGNLNHSFGVFSQVQEARRRVQKVADHLVIDLKDTEKKKTHLQQFYQVAGRLCQTK